MSLLGAASMFGDNEQSLAILLVMVAPLETERRGPLGLCGFCAGAGSDMVQITGDCIRKPLNLSGGLVLAWAGVARYIRLLISGSGVRNLRRPAKTQH
jgi:hypothetical protein